MTQDEFEAKWYADQHIVDDLYASFDGDKIHLKKGDQVISVIAEDLKYLTIYESFLRKDIRKLLKMGEYEEKDDE